MSYIFCSSRSAARRPGRRLALLAAAVAVSATALSLGAGAASADTLVNTGTVHLGNYRVPVFLNAAMPVPGTPEDNGFLPSHDGSIGQLTTLILGRLANYTDPVQVLESSDSSASWGTEVRTDDSMANAIGQRFRFQRVGWVGVQSPAVDGVTRVVGAPVYRILSISGTAGSPLCLEASGGSGAAFTDVDQYGCNPNQTNQTNQLWVVASAAQSNATFTPAGVYDHGSAGEDFSPALQQADASTATGLQDSVLFNLASLNEHGWKTAETPVLSATVDNMLGRDTRLQLMPPTTWPANANNSTWNIAAPLIQDDRCAGLTGYALLVCGEAD